MRVRFFSNTSFSIGYKFLHSDSRVCLACVLPADVPIRSTLIPARTKHASRSSYVPGQPQRPNPGTCQASFPLIIRVLPAATLQSRHVPGMFAAIHTCPASHIVSIPARTSHVSRSSYVPGEPQRSNPGTCQASVPPFIRARRAAAFQSRHVPGMFAAIHTCPASCGR